MTESFLSTFNPNAAAQPGSGIYGLPCTLEESSVVIVPVPFEVTTSFGGGTARAPAAIRKASEQVDLFDPFMGKPYEQGIFMMKPDPRIVALNRRARPLAKEIIQSGGVIKTPSRLQRSLDRVNDACSEMLFIVEDTVTGLKVQNKIVGVVGGDHSVSYGAIMSAIRNHGEIGILHIDAHCDLRNCYEGFDWSHASVMFNVMESAPKHDTKLVQIGVRDYCEEESDYIRNAYRQSILFVHGSEIIPGRSLDVDSFTRFLPKQVYISFDIDGLDPANCPNTGTPVPGGLTFYQAIELIRGIAERCHIVGFDLVEVGPQPWDANVGARILYQLIGWTLKSQENATK